MPPHHAGLFLGSLTHTLYCASVLHHQRIYTASAPVYGASILHERNVLRCRFLIEYHFFFLIGRGNPPPVSDTAVRVMQEFNKLMKKVPCSEGLVRPHVKVSNFVVMLKFKQVFFFSIKESLVGLIGPIRYQYGRSSMTLFFVQLFGEAVELNDLKMGTLGCVETCCGEGEAYILHIASSQPSARLVEDFRADGFVLHGTASVGQFLFFV